MFELNLCCNTIKIGQHECSEYPANVLSIAVHEQYNGVSSLSRFVSTLDYGSSFLSRLCTTHIRDSLANCIV